MPSILNLKFKGNKSFVAFSNLNDTESLTKTWKVCTKVASYLEQGQRLENLSWRLWHLQNLMVDTDNAKSKREFKKLSKCMGDKLDKEKGRSIEELEAPDFKRNHSSEMIRQRAAEKERSREASQNATPGTIKRMQFTFSVDQPAQPSPGAPVKKPDTKPSAEFTRRAKPAAQARAHHDEDTVMADAATHSESSPAGPAEPAPSTSASDFSSTSSSTGTYPPSLHFPGLFGNDFGPSALLYAAPTCTTRMNYGEGFNPSGNNDQFSISRPTIELALDDLLFNDEASNDDSHNSWMSGLSNNENQYDSSSSNTVEKDDASASANITAPATAGQQQDVVMSQAAPTLVAPATTPAPVNVIHTRKASTSKAASVPAIEDDNSYGLATTEDLDELSPAPSTARKTSIFKNVPPLSQSVKDVLPETVAPSRLSSIYGTRSSTPATSTRPTLTLRTQSVSTRSSGPSATATTVNASALRGPGGSALNSAPGGVKAECSNCGATHTPLWRRGLNDELNCNACGLYCKLHKRPRPKSMRNSHGGEGRAASQVVQRQEAPDVMGKSIVDSKSPPLYSDPVRPSVAAQCYNCHTTATPLWRKDDEGKTVCNACGLYYKLHGSARPISMKSDVIRKRSRHDARRSGVPEDTPSASPGVSRRPSPAPETSPTLAPDSTTQITYDFPDPDEYRSSVTSSELMGALGSSTDSTAQALNNFTFPLSFSNAYHPEYLMQLYNLPNDALPFSSVDSVSGDADLTMSPRSPKRRRMSTDSGDEPPASAGSFGSFAGDGFNSGTSSASGSTAGSSAGGNATGRSSGTHSKRSSMDSFPFSSLGQGPALRGSGNTFWHPPMMPQSGADSDVPIFQSSATLPNPSSSSSSSSNNNSNTGASTPSSSSSTSEDSPMDYLHQPALGLQDEESLFSTFLHPPMALPEDGSKAGQDEGVHGSMYVESYFH